MTNMDATNERTAHGAPSYTHGAPAKRLTVQCLCSALLPSYFIRNGRVSLATPRGQLREETSPWAARLHGLFEETLTDLVHQRNAVPKPGGGYPESYAPDSSQTEPLSGVGWVEVVRRVSLRSVSGRLRGSGRQSFAPHPEARRSLCEYCGREERRPELRFL